MDLKAIIQPERCVLLKNNKKNEVLLELIDIVESQKAVKDIEELKKEIFYREQLMSTGIGMSIAVPHVRFSGASDPVVLVGVQPKGISDYETLDDKEIKIVIMIIVAKEHHREYIRLLSLLMSTLKSEDTREKLVSIEDQAEIADLLRES